MIGKRELTVGDYRAIVRRRIWVVLVPATIAAAVSFGISFLFPPRYTSKALMLVEEQKVPEGFVKPVITEELAQRITNAQAQILSRSRLQPIIERYNLQKTPFGTQTLEETLEGVRKSVTVSPLETDFTSAQRRPGRPEEVAGFHITYSGADPEVAHKVCGELASMFVDEDLRQRQQAAQGTTDFLTAQVDEAKLQLDDQDAKLATFKQRYFGQLPDQQDENLKILSGLNTQLDAATQSINRAQQDKAYAESVLQQALIDWKASLTKDPKDLEQQLANLQAQLISLQGRYTDQHPDVIKTKKDIAEVKRKIHDLAAAGPAQMPAEPPDIVKLRAQIQQDKEVIEQATTQQANIEKQIHLYQSRLQLSPRVEEQYKKLTRDYDTAKKFYDGLLANKSESQVARDMERRQQGEQIRLADAADLPDQPSFPNRLLFAGGGLGGGFALGVGLALMFELGDQSIRSELDVAACLELPTLVSVPWVYDLKEVNHSKNGKRLPAQTLDSEQGDRIKA